MDRKSSFLSQKYKSGFIHSCFNHDTGEEEIKVNLPNGEIKTVKTIIGAKRVISKYIG